MRSPSSPGAAHLALATLLLASGCRTIPDAGSAQGPSSGPAPTCPATRSQQVVESTNALRARHGLTPLLVDSRLSRAALAHSRDLAASGGDGHTGSDGSLPTQRVEREAYAWLFLGENVAVGWRTADEVVLAWMRSPVHRENLLSEEARHLGVGHVRRPGTAWGDYWTAVYGDSREPRVAPPGECHP